MMMRTGAVGDRAAAPVSEYSVAERGAALFYT
jgi:hypothetical protein